MRAIGLDEFLDSPAAERPAVLADLDGCLIAGGKPLPHACRLVARLGERLTIVSNNSSDTAATLAAQLERIALPIAPARLVLAGEEAVRLLASRRPGARVALFASEPIVALAERLGLRPDRDRAEIALLARAPDFDLADLAQLAALAHRGTELWLSNPDTSHPGPDGTPVPETGALMAALAAMVAVTPAIVVGKPAPGLVRRALDRSAVAACDAVFIGDTAATDGLAAQAAGVPFVLVRRPGDEPAARPRGTVEIAQGAA